MSQENIEIVRRAYEAWNRRDFDETIAHIDPDVDWGFEGASRFPGTEASYQGHEGVREFWRVFIEPWTDFRIEIEKTYDAGEAVVVFVVFHGKVGGIELSEPFGHVIWVRDHRCVRFRSFDDRKAALEAAGLSE